MNNDSLFYKELEEKLDNALNLARVERSTKKFIYRPKIISLNTYKEWLISLNTRPENFRNYHISTFKVMRKEITFV